MTDTKMNFKDALIAHLQGESVQCWAEDGFALEGWMAFSETFADTSVRHINNVSAELQFRIKPRTVMCNGVEVPAPESVSPAVYTLVWIPDPCGHGDMCYSTAWGKGPDYFELLGRDIVYLNKEDAIARAKAMLITK